MQGAFRSAVPCTCSGCTKLELDIAMHLAMASVFSPSASIDSPFHCVAIFFMSKA